MTFKGWISGVPVAFSFVEIVERRTGETKWRKVIRPSFLAFSALFILFMLFLCNVAISDPHIKNTSAWSVSKFMQGSRTAETPNCTVVERSKPITEQRSPSPSPCAKSIRREGTESLPSGIVEPTSDLERRHLWKLPDVNPPVPQNLLALAVGIKQKRNVDLMIEKFPAENFTIMLFHYDGKVDGWMDLEWSAKAIHVVASNQTKWWFAKRFLHPDIVAKYEYIFLWDEDIGVENFHAGRYLDVMEDEGLEISQPALHPKSRDVHHRLTLRQPKERVHRRYFGTTGRTNCTLDSSGPPCTGWVEMMAPVFSRAAWRCTWHLIQNDLVHAWGLDFKLGYCAQGIRSEKVGIIDTEYIVHEGIPSLGGPRLEKVAPAANQTEGPEPVDTRNEIRRKSSGEMNNFARRWRRAAAKDNQWQDPYTPKRINRTVEEAEYEVLKRQQQRPIPAEYVIQKLEKSSEGKPKDVHGRVL